MLFANIEEKAEWTVEQGEEEYRPGKKKGRGY
jgi:hypothetical protein